MNIRVLILDDNSTLLELLSLFLEKEPGIIVTYTARNWALAVDYLVKHHQNTDIVVTDIRMLLMNRFDVMKEISRLWPHIKVIAMATDTRDLLVGKSLDVGAKGFFYKGDLLTSLTEGIQRVYRGEVYLSPEAAEAMSRTF